MGNYFPQAADTSAPKGFILHFRGVGRGEGVSYPSAPLTLPSPPASGGRGSGKFFSASGGGREWVCFFPQARRRACRYGRATSGVMSRVLFIPGQWFGWEKPYGRLPGGACSRVAGSYIPIHSVTVNGHRNTCAAKKNLRSARRRADAQASAAALRLERKPVANRPLSDFELYRLTSRKIDKNSRLAPAEPWTACQNGAFQLATGFAR
ncbi:MAG: hypothetical protein KatS3mg110_3213 [Pirellulaceae bacterium]|nr:MAG: hypothetical protein KatS3mg110_3213 [Pirellulaceae bacterium]